jgi:hypothetical protein
MFNEMKETDGMKLLTIFAALLAAFAVGGGLALATGGGSSSDIDLTGNTGTTTEIGTTTGDDAFDISGPCDEAEHANDPRCTGVTVPGAGTTTGDDALDISGPCDEAEHANDPRCTGAAPADSSGPGPGGQDDDDRSGRSHGEDDNSGHNGGDDDNSGPGSESGSGSSGSG